MHEGSEIDLSPDGPNLSRNEPDLSKADLAADDRVRLSLGAPLRAARERAGLSRSASARAVGVSEAMLARWERGEGSLWRSGPVDYAALRKLSEAYGCKLSELLPRNNYPSAPVDPALRRDWVRRRNAAIQGVDEDEYLATIASRNARVDAASAR